MFSKDRSENEDPVFSTDRSEKETAVNGVGANLLGQILMELREEFRQEELVREDYARD